MRIGIRLTLRNNQRLAPETQLARHCYGALQYSASQTAASPYRRFAMSLAADSELASTDSAATAKEDAAEEKIPLKKEQRRSV